MCEMDAVYWPESYHIRNRNSNRNRERKVIITKSWYDRKNQFIDESSILRYCRTRISIRMFIRWIWFMIFILIYWINNHCIHTDHHFIFISVGAARFFWRKKSLQQDVKVVFQQHHICADFWFLFYQTCESYHVHYGIFKYHGDMTHFEYKLMLIHKWEWKKISIQIRRILALKWDRYWFMGNSKIFFSC